MIPSTPDKPSPPPSTDFVIPLNAVPPNASSAPLINPRPAPANPAPVVLAPPAKAPPRVLAPAAKLLSLDSASPDCVIPIGFRSLADANTPSAAPASLCAATLVWTASLAPAYAPCAPLTKPFPV